MNEQARREAALRRRLGASPRMREAVEQVNAVADNWRGKCRLCGAVLMGTRRQIMEHRCAADSA